MPVTIIVPEETTARFVVAADRIPGNVPAVLRRSLAGPLAKAVADRLGTPALMVTAHPAGASPWDLGDAAGGTDADTEAIDRADRHIGVTSVLPADDLPFGLHAVRSTALAIAAETCGVPVDLDTNRVLPALRHDGFVLADDWLGAVLPPYRDGGRCTVPAEEPGGCTCVDLRTRGLHRFGLPELQITEVACPHRVPALNILRTAAQRLLPLGRHPGRHRVASEPALTAVDFAAFWGGREPMWDDGPVPVRLVEAGPERLAIEQPEDFPGTFDQWLWDELPPAFHRVLNCEPERTPAGPPGG